MSRVFVTGATGYIGGHLVPFLMSHGHEVRCLVRRTSNIGALQQLGVDLWVSDTLDEATLRQATRNCDFVYHLAGKTSARHRHELYAVNAIGTERVARACAAHLTPPILILVSSLAAAGTSSASRLRTEADPARAVSWYGRSKRAGEIAAVKWSRHVPLSIVRPGIVFGPANRDLLPVFQSIARWGIHVVPGYTPRRVSLIHHEDLLEILTCVAQRGCRVSPPGTTAAEAEHAVRQGRNPTECFRTQGSVASVGRSISCQENNISTVRSAERQGRNPTECFRTQGSVASVGRSISCRENNISTVPAVQSGRAATRRSASAPREASLPMIVRFLAERTTFPPFAVQDNHAGSTSLRIPSNQRIFILVA